MVPLLSNEGVLNPGPANVRVRPSLKNAHGLGNLPESEI